MTYLLLAASRTVICDWDRLMRGRLCCWAYALTHLAAFALNTCSAQLPPSSPITSLRENGLTVHVRIINTKLILVPVTSVRFCFEGAYGMHVIGQCKGTGTLFTQVGKQTVQPHSVIPRGLLQMRTTGAGKIQI